MSERVTKDTRGFKASPALPVAACMVPHDQHNILSLFHKCLTRVLPACQHACHTCGNPVCTPPLTCINSHWLLVSFDVKEITINSSSSMAVSYSIPFLSETVPVSVQFLAAGVLFIVLSFVYSTLTSERPYPGFPVISLSEQGLGPKASWFRHGKATILRGIEQTKGPFQIVTGTGPKIVVPNRFADELKSHESLNFNEAFAKDFFADYPGFEAHRQGLQDDSLIQEIVRVKLTQSLGLVTDDLVDETTASIHDIFGEDREWHTAPLKENILDMVTRLSSRVFLGKELCRDERWLDIAKNYTVGLCILIFALLAPINIR